MKTEDQIKALAELDGWPEPEKYMSYILRGHDYLTSYDAIIPLIQKQPKHIQMKAASHCWWEWSSVDKDEQVEAATQMKKDIIFGWNLTPAQLSEALLRATGKWTEK